MKKIILSALSVIGIAMAAQAQCDQTVQISSSKTNMLDETYQVKGSKDEQVVVDITKTTVTITNNGKTDDALVGQIKDMQCAWKLPFKEGKTVIKTDLVDRSGDVKEATITIEGKDGKIILIAEAKERPDQKIQLEVNKFEQKAESR
jgi:K+-transporting ATPase c subunit